MLVGVRSVLVGVLSNDPDIQSLFGEARCSWGPKPMLGCRRLLLRAAWMTLTMGVSTDIHYCLAIANQPWVLLGA